MAGEFIGDLAGLPASFTPSPGLLPLTGGTLTGDLHLASGKALIFDTLGGPHLASAAQDMYLTSGVALGSGLDAAIMLAGNYRFYLGPCSLSGGRGAAIILSDEQGSMFEMQQFASSYIRLQTGRPGHGIRLTTQSGDITTEVGPGGNLYLDTTNGAVDLRPSGLLKFQATALGVGFNGAAAIAKPSANGSRGGNAALASALVALANLGLLTDNTVP